MRTEILSQGSNNYCFVCGQTNPIGLKLKFYLENNSYVVTEFTPRKEHCGWKNVVHGGILCAIMDETMSWAVLHIKKETGVTKEMNLKFKHPVFINEKIMIRSKITNASKKEIRLLSEIINQNGVICTVAEGIYAILDKEKINNLFR